MPIKCHRQAPLDWEAPIWYLHLLLGHHIMPWWQLLHGRSCRPQQNVSQLVATNTLQHLTAEYVTWRSLTMKSACNDLKMSRRHSRRVGALSLPKTHRNLPYKHILVKSCITIQAWGRRSRFPSWLLTRKLFALLRVLKLPGVPASLPSNAKVIDP